MVWVLYCVLINLLSHCFCYKLLLISCKSYEFYWVSTPYLHCWDNSSRWDNTVWQNDSPCLYSSSFQNNRVRSDKASSVNITTVESATGRNDCISNDLKICRQSIRKARSSVQNAIIPDDNIFMQTTLNSMYKTAFISPRITVPWPTHIFFPMYTSPINVALGATNRLPNFLGCKLYKDIKARAFEIDYEYFFGASIAFEFEEKRQRIMLRLIKFFNMSLYYYNYTMFSYHYSSTKSSKSLFSRSSSL